MIHIKINYQYGPGSYGFEYEDFETREDYHAFMDAACKDHRVKKVIGLLSYIK